MSKNKNTSFLIFGFALTVIFSAFFILGAWAANLENIEFPIAELGNCQSQETCEAYCNQEANMTACLDFAEKHQILSQAEIQKARKMAELGVTAGPGGCRSDAECESYCNNQDQMVECIEFAKEHGLMSPEELREAEQVLRALKQGAALPGGCSNKSSCEAYCEDLNHLQECLAFGEAAGFISKEEAAMVKKTGGQGPGGCRGKAECDAYCQGPAHMKECIDFAIKYDIMPPAEKEGALMMLRAMEKGVNPPNCGGKEECDVYCSQAEHMEECMNFAVASGMMSEEEAKEARQMMALGITSGPGGCKGKKECEEFCEQPANMVACVEFGIKVGMIPPEQAAQALKMAELGLTGGPGGCKNEKECEDFCNNPDNAVTCTEFALKMGFISEEEAQLNLKMAEKGIFGGPGGCKEQAECEAFCENPENFEECTNFALEAGMISPAEAQERIRSLELMQKCGEPEQCFNYCLENQSDPLCQEFIKLSEEEVMMHQERRYQKEEGPPAEMRDEEFKPPKEQETMLPLPQPPAEMTGEDFRPGEMAEPEEFKLHEEIMREVDLRHQEMREEVGEIIEEFLFLEPEVQVPKPFAEEVQPPVEPQLEHD